MMLLMHGEKIKMCYPTVVSNIIMIENAKKM
jgi:hypothetical protein